MQASRVTTVIAAYNAEQFVERAIRSALAQTRPPAEILVVDDGSTDSTRERVSAFGGPVRCIVAHHAGAAAARNSGIEAASGEWLAFLDADDEWLAPHLELALECLARQPELVWSCAAYARGPVGGDTQERRPAEARLSDGSSFESYCTIARDWTVSMNSLVVRRSIFDEVGGFAPDLVTGEDLDLWFRIALEHPRIGYVPQVTSLYWTTPGSLTSRGLDTASAWAELLGRNAARAAALGPDAEQRSRPLLLRWACEVIRAAILEGDRAALSRIPVPLQQALPARWRALAELARATPDALRRGALGLWEATRSLRGQVRRR